MYILKREKQTSWLSRTVLSGQIISLIDNNNKTTAVIIDTVLSEQSHHCDTKSLFAIIYRYIYL